MNELQSNHMRKSVPSVITKVIARQILDSRGIPTVEVDLHTNKGVFRASTPSGVSSGMYVAYVFATYFSVYCVELIQGEFYDSCFVWRTYEYKFKLSIYLKCSCCVMN